MQQNSYQCKALYERVVSHLNRGNGREAAMACKELCETFPGFAEGWHKGSIVALQLGNPAKAMEYIDRAIELESNNLRHKMQKARLLLAQGHVSEAEALAEEVALSAEQCDVNTISSLGGFYSSLGKHELARNYYQRIQNIEPSTPVNYFNLAATQRFLGNLEASEQAYDEGIKVDPNYYEAYMIRAGLRKQTITANHIDEMKSVLDRGTNSWTGEVQICYALAKELEDLEEYEESFSYLKRGADLRRSQIQYDVENDLRTIDKIIETYSKEVVDDIKKGDARDQPIFILGLPRTGTTLVERILGNHSAVCSAGELNKFAVELTKLVKATTASSLENKIQRVVASTKIDFNQLGQRYLRSVHSSMDSKVRFIDKMPLNYLYCGLIAMALPQAKIIELVRHPLDTCYAIYKQLFTRAYPFSYDLDDLGRYYLAQRKLMAHWHAVIPDRIHQVRYEDLVMDQEYLTRELLDYCGLEWEDACLEFEKNREASTTASAAQVRQPIYRSSLNKWQNFFKQLQPLVNMFTDAGIEL